MAKFESIIPLEGNRQVRMTWRDESLTLKLFLEEQDMESQKTVKPYIMIDFTSINATKVSPKETGKLALDFVERNSLMSHFDEIQEAIDVLIKSK